MEIPVKCSNMLPCLVSFIAAMEILLLLLLTLFYYCSVISSMHAGKLYPFCEV